MKEILPNIKKISEHLKQLLREGLRGMSEFLGSPSRPENALADAQRAGSYFANLNAAKIDEGFLKSLEE